MKKPFAVAPAVQTFLRASLARFLLAGFTNTLVTYLLYLVLLILLPYALSYTIAFVAGIILSAFMTQKFVFRRNYSRTGLTLFPLIYLGQYLTGLGLLHTLIDRAGVSERLAPLLVVMVTVPLVYVASRLLLRVR